LLDVEKGSLISLSFFLRRYEHNFEHAHYEHDKIDALAMSKLTFSPFVVNAYAFCGRSVVTEFAGGPRLGSVFDKARKHDLKRLGIARDLATGLSHVHYGKSGNEVQFVHFDINPANVVVIDKNTLRINDFNIAKAIKLNATSGDQCSVPLHQYPNAQWRSPEEVKKQDDLSVKVDVFSLGHIFYRMIVGHEPWNKMEKGGRKPSSDELVRKVGAGVLPRIPPQIFESNDKELVAIRKAMMMCYTVDVSKRPTSKAIAKFLDDEWLRLKREM
jgi:serine/threonine protein kinase